MKSKVLLSTLAAGIAASALLAAAPASATIQHSFTEGGVSPEAGYVVINDFNDNTGLSGVENTDYKIMTGSDSSGAQPANDLLGGNYLSVLGGGTVSLSFDPVSSFEFDWGSIDAYNTLTIHAVGHDDIVIPGSAHFPNDANGNQTAIGTNGLFKVWGDDGEIFTGITLASGQNSFEIDNLAVPGGVPEPASWALMISGFGMAGGLLRAKRRKQAFA